MIRKKLVAIAAMAALGLAACGSTSGGTSAGTSGADQVSGASDTSASAGSASAGSASSGSASGSASAGSPSAGSGSADSAGSGSAPKTTIGNGGLDAQSANWFNTACTGMAPLADMEGDMSSIDPTKPEQAQQTMVDLYNKMGDSFTDTAGKLKSLPPPTFEKGDEMASKFVSAMSTAGPELKKAASTLESANVSDAQSFQQAMQQVQESMGQAMGGLDIMGGYELDSKTRDAIQALPACQVLSQTFG